MAGQLPNLAQAASRFQKQAGQAIQNAPAQMAQAIKQQAASEIKAAANTVTEQVGVDEFLDFEDEAPQEPPRQGEIPKDQLEPYRAEVKQREQQALAALHARIKQMSGQRMQMEQAYHQRVDEQIQAAAVQQQEAPVELPQPNRPSAKKSAELQKKKN